MGRSCGYGSALILRIMPELLPNKVKVELEQLTEYMNYLDAVKPDAERHTMPILSTTYTASSLY